VLASLRYKPDSLKVAISAFETTVYTAKKPGKRITNLSKREAEYVRSVSEIESNDFS